MAGSLAPSRTARCRAKATSQPPFLWQSEKANGASPAASPAPGHSPRGGFLWGQPDQQHRAVSKREQHPRSFELLYHRLHTHTSKHSANRQFGSTKQSCRVPECLLTPGTPPCIAPASTRHFWGSQFWPRQPLGPTEKMNSLAATCTSKFLLPSPPPGLKGSFEMPTGFSRNEIPPARNCDPQHSYTQRNSRSVI